MNGRSYAVALKRSFLLIFLLGIPVVAIDFLTKYLVQSHLPIHDRFPYYPYGGIAIFRNFFGIDFSIVHAINQGAAWSILSNYQSFLMVVRFVLVIGLIIYFFCYNRSRSWIIPLTLVIAGALGNIIDYFLYHHVIDFLHFSFWGYDFPVFNLADCSIFIGISWMLIASFFTEEE